jgi:hypothetical protein
MTFRARTYPYLAAVGVPAYHDLTRGYGHPGDGITSAVGAAVSARDPPRLVHGSVVGGAKR